MQTRSGSGTPRGQPAFNALSLGQELSGAGADATNNFDFSAFEDVVNNGNPIEDPPSDFDVDPIL